MFRISLNKLGEIRMGTDAYGITVECDNGEFLSLSEVPVLIAASGEKPEIIPDQSDDGRYVILEGEFATYIFDLDELAISLIRSTVRGKNGIWCEETPILGNSTRHVDVKSGKHYYIQYPFVVDTDFNLVWEEYANRRLEQIHEMQDAT